MLCWFHFVVSLVRRYQYYLQVKKDVLDGRLRSSLEQGIRLAALAVQGAVSTPIFFLVLSVSSIITELHSS